MVWLCVGMSMHQLLLLIIVKQFLFLVVQLTSLDLTSCDTSKFEIFQLAKCELKDLGGKKKEGKFVFCDIWS